MLAIIIFFALAHHYNVGSILEFWPIMYFALVFAAARILWPRPVKSSDEPRQHLLPEANDKMILVKGGRYDTLQKIISDFKEDYEEQVVVAAVASYAETSWVIIFPNNIDSRIFYYLINYLVYPIDVIWDAEITGWQTLNINQLDKTKSGEIQVMIFVSKNDLEYDNVFIATASGDIYEFEENITKRDKDKYAYKPNIIKPEELVFKPI
jgi:hypothetical protein